MQLMRCIATRASSFELSYTRLNTTSGGLETSPAKLETRPRVGCSQCLTEMPSPAGQAGKASRSSTELECYKKIFSRPPPLALTRQHLLQHPFDHLRASPPPRAEEPSADLTAPMAPRAPPLCRSRLDVPSVSWRLGLCRTLQQASPSPFSPCTSCPPGGAQRPRGQTEGRTHWGYAPLRSPVLQYPLDSRELRRGAIHTTGGGGAGGLTNAAVHPTEHGKPPQTRRHDGPRRSGRAHTGASLGLRKSAVGATKPGMVSLATRKQARWCRCMAEPLGPSPLLRLCTLKEYGSPVLTAFTREAVFAGTRFVVLSYC